MAKGKIEEPRIWDDTVKASYGEADFPVKIPLDHVIAGWAIGTNTTSSIQFMTLTIELIDPDGVSRGKGSYSHNIYPGLSIGKWTDDVIADKPGAWKLHVILEVAEAKEDEKTWNAVTAEGMPGLANLYGFIHEKNDTPIAAVSVKLNEHSAATKVDGNFSFTELEPRGYAITCTKIGWEKFTTDVTLEEGDNGIDITMVKEEVPAKLPWKWIGAGVGIVAAIIGTVKLVARRAT